MTATAAPSVRLSATLNACPRKAVYTAIGAPARERTDREERILFRGRRIGRDYADLLEQKYGAEALERERKVVWPFGVGHIDVYLPATRTAIEVLSSAHASETMIHGKLLQLVGYIEHDSLVDNGVLVVLDPGDFTEERIIVNPKSAPYADLVDEMLARVDQVRAWQETGTLPARVCAKPTEARGRFCLHGEHCFDGWEPPELEEIAADETVVAAVAEYASLAAARREAEAVAKRLKDQQDDAKAALEAAELPAGVDVQIGPFKVRRTAVNRSASFEWKKAELAGMFNPDPVADFFKPGASYSTFKAERVDHSGDEYGEEAPF